MAALDRCTRLAICLLCWSFLIIPSPIRAQSYPPSAVNPDGDGFATLCDTSFQNCRDNPGDGSTYSIRALIARETVGIDVAYWFMNDMRYATDLIIKFTAGVPVRVLFDLAANPTYGGNRGVVSNLAAGGIPMRTRNRTESLTVAILHWKMFLFRGQNTVAFTAGDFGPQFFGAPPDCTPYVNYIDEVLYVTSDSSVVNSFKTMYDDAWTTTSAFNNYANITTLTRVYPTFSIDPALNFSPFQDFGARTARQIDSEPASGQLDIFMYRLTSVTFTDAVIRAVNRGVKARMIAEVCNPADSACNSGDGTEYRNPKRQWDSYNVDLIYKFGIAAVQQGLPGLELKGRAHAGLSHEKAVILHGQAMTIFGSSNWTTPSAYQQYEHNYFTTKAWFTQWFKDHFDRKWNNVKNAADGGGATNEFAPFIPLPPDKPAYQSPANGATGIGSSVTLRWEGGYWSHKFDIYLGTSPNPPLLVADARYPSFGPSQFDSLTGAPRLATGDVKAGVSESYNVSNLLPGTTYYWKIVDKTMADLTATSAVQSFTTSGTPSNPPPSGVSATAISESEIQVAWSAASGATSYTLERSPDSSSWSTIATPAATATSYTDSGLLAATTYYYRMSATYPTGTSAYSAVVSATTQTPGSTPPGWNDLDIGSVGFVGSARLSGSTYTVRGSGVDVWNYADAFNFMYQPLDGDGQIVVRVTSVQNTALWSKAGVMIRETLTPGSAHAFMLVSYGKGVAFQRRVARNGISTHTPGPFTTAPYWVKLVRAGNTISAYASADGATWAQIGSDTFSMATSVYVGLAVTAHNNTALCTATFDSLTVSVATPPTLPPTPTGLTATAQSSSQIQLMWNASSGATSYTLQRSPDGSTGWTTIATPSATNYTDSGLNASTTYYYRVAASNAAGTSEYSTVVNATTQPSGSIPPGWNDLDIGSVGFGGSAALSGSIYTMRGSGVDVWNYADAFNFMYRPLDGDGQIVVRVTSVQNTSPWSKAGVMIRETLTPGSAHAFMLVSYGKGVAFQRRVATNGMSTHTPGPFRTAPHWVKLVRAGNTISAYASSDGATWTLVGSDTFSMATSVYVGLAVTAHNNAALCTATFDNLTVSE